MAFPVQETTQDASDRAFFQAIDTNGRQIFSQLGEDLSILHLLQHKRDGRYVDVGCHHPFRYSNTALLHRDFGWTGINIDADARAIEAFDHHRPNDVNLHLAVGATEGWVELAVFTEGAVNSVIPEVVSAIQHQWGAPTMKPVQMRPLANILADHPGPVDLLSVDVEGLDLQVLQSMDWSNAPTVVAVEIHGFDPGDPNSNPTYAYMKNLGYRLASYVIVTAIFVRQ